MTKDPAKLRAQRDRNARQLRRLRGRLASAREREADLRARLETRERQIADLTVDLEVMRRHLGDGHG